MSFDSKASDSEYWMRHVLRTSLPYQTEQGRAYTASDIWTIDAGATEYLEFRVPEGRTVRIYDRFTVTEGDPFEIDLCAVSSITAGVTELNHTNMQVTQSAPTAKVYRGATSPVGLIVKERSLLPAQRGPQSSGGIAEQMSYRVLKYTQAPSILRITNTGSTDRLFNIIIVYTEQDE